MKMSISLKSVAYITQCGKIAFISVNIPFLFCLWSFQLIFSKIDKHNRGDMAKSSESN